MKIIRITVALLASFSAVLLMMEGCSLKNAPTTSFGEDSSSASVTPTFTSTTVSPKSTSTPTPTATITSTPTETFTPTPVVPTPTPTPVVIITVTSTNFNQVVLNSSIPVMVDCGASWCGWCSAYAPIVQQFANDYAGKITVVKVDCSNGAPSFLNGYGVSVYPTSLFFKNGKLDQTILGYVLESTLITTYNSL